jgi:hypothetical protein
LESYSRTRIPRVSGLSRIARQLTTSYSSAPLASNSPTPSSEAYEDTTSTSPSEDAVLALEEYCAPHEMAFAAGLPEITVYPETLRAALAVHLTALIDGKLFALSLIIVKVNRFVL